MTNTNEYNEAVELVGLAIFKEFERISGGLAKDYKELFLRQCESAAVKAIDVLGIEIISRENATLKAQLDRVRDTNWMRQFIIEYSNDSWNVADKIVKELQNYILGGEGV